MASRLCGRHERAGIPMLKRCLSYKIAVRYVISAACRLAAQRFYDES